MSVVLRSTPLIVLAAVVAVAFPSRAAVAAPLPPQIVAEVTLSGGLCPIETCRTTHRLGRDGRLWRDGRLVRRVPSREVATLLRAIARIDLVELRRHPFTGICPTAYDGQEASYRFRGVATVLRSCRWQVRRLEAVRLLDRLVAG